MQEIERQPFDRKEYMKEYREENRDHINHTQREWYENNKKRMKRAQIRYWNRKGEELKRSNQI